MGVYTYEDLKEAFKYARKNQKNKLKDFLEYRSLFISKKDLKSFYDIEYNTFNIILKSKEYIFYYFRSVSHSSMNRFINRFVGDKGYYDFSPVDGYGYSYRIVSFNEDFYDVDNWDDFSDEYKGVKSIKNENFEFIFDDMPDDTDENVINSYCRYIDDKSRVHTRFWSMGDRVEIFMFNDNNIKFNKIDKLFKIIK